MKNKIRLYSDHNLPLELILNMCLIHFGITAEDLKGPRRFLNIVKARNVFCWLAFHFSRIPLVEIGLFLGNRDHTTICNSVRITQNSIDINDGYVSHQINKLSLQCLEIESQPYLLGPRIRKQRRFNIIKPVRNENSKVRRLTFNYRPKSA